MDRPDTRDEELLWLRLRFRENARLRGIAYAERAYACDVETTVHFRTRRSVWSWIRFAMCT